MSLESDYVLRQANEIIRDARPEYKSRTVFLTARQDILLSGNLVALDSVRAKSSDSDMGRFTKYIEDARLEQIARKLKDFNERFPRGFKSGYIDLDFGEIDFIGRYLLENAEESLGTRREFSRNAKTCFMLLNQSFVSLGGADNSEVREAFSRLPIED